MDIDERFNEWFDKRYPDIPRTFKPMFKETYKQGRIDNCNNII